MLNRPRTPARARAGRGALALVSVVGAASLAACGSQGISVPTSSTYYRGAVLFREHCSGCHTLTVVGAQGSATNVKDRLRNQGPNFNFRTETVENVLYAIRNGGFSGVIMPQNVVVGEEALEVAKFLAAYAGTKAPKVPSVEIPAEEPSSSTGATGSSASAAGSPAKAGGTAAPANAHAHK